MVPCRVHARYLWRPQLLTRAQSLPAGGRASCVIYPLCSGHKPEPDKRLARETAAVSQEERMAGLPGLAAVPCAQ
jgi:hypothetical protein